MKTTGVFRSILVCIILSIGYSCLKNTSEDKKSNTDSDNLKSQNNELSDNQLKKIETFENEDNYIVLENLRFGSGYNSSTLRETYGVLEYQGSESEYERSVNTIGNTGIVEVYEIFDSEELRKTLKISTNAALDFNYKGFDSKNKYNKTVYRETRMNSFSTKIALKAEYVNDPIYILNPKMKKEAIAMAEKNGNEFMKEYGDMFVSRIYTGGEFLGLLDVQNTTTTDSTFIKEFISSANSYFSNNLSFNRTKEESQWKELKANELNSKFISRGGTLPKDLKPETLRNFAKTFKASVEANQKPVVLFVELSGYENLPGFPKIDFSHIRIDQRNYLNEAQLLIESVNENLNNIDFVLNHKQYFNPKVYEDITESINYYEEYLDRINSGVRRCRSDFNDCNESNLPDLNELETFTPNMDYSYFFFNGARLQSAMENDVNGNVKQYNNWDTIIKITNPLIEIGENAVVIDGHLKSKWSHKPNEPSECRSAIYNAERYYSGKKKKVYYKYGIRKRDNPAIYGYFSKPFYEIRLESTLNNEKLRQYSYDGKPIIFEKDQRILVRLVNKNIEHKYNWKGGVYTASYSEPRFIGVKECEDHPTLWKGIDRNKVQDYLQKSNYSSAISTSVQGGVTADKNFVKIEENQFLKNHLYYDSKENSFKVKLD